jgi:AcrR family transcriptional regulator
MSATYKSEYKNVHLTIMKDFIRARTAEQIADRRNEIVSACEQIYTAGGFDAVTFKAISEKTSFTRPSIYNYYATKEEVMLDLLSRYFVDWYSEIRSQLSDKAPSREEVCRVFAEVSEKYQNMFLIFTDLKNIEDGCRVERIVDFKRHYIAFEDFFEALVARSFPNAARETIDAARSGIIILFHGAYPVTHSSEKQIQAIKEAGGKVQNRPFKEVFFGQMMLLTAGLV